MWKRQWRFWPSSTVLVSTTSNTLDIPSHQSMMSIWINYLWLYHTRLDHVWSALVNSVSEMRDKFGRRVVILKLGEVLLTRTTEIKFFIGKWDPDLIPVEEWFASTFVMLEVLTKESKTQIAGLTMLLDCQGFSFNHIRLEDRWVSGDQ